MEPLLKWAIEQISLEGLQDALWDALRRRDDLEFFRVTGTKPPALEHEGGLKGFLEHEREPIDRAGLAVLSSLSIPPDQLRMVASPARRLAVLDLTKEKGTQISAIQFSFLELITRERREGLKQRDLARIVKMAPKMVFHHLKSLDLRYGLIVRKPIMDATTVPHTPTNLLFHKQFAPCDSLLTQPLAAAAAAEAADEAEQKSKKKKSKREVASYFLYPAYMLEISKLINGAKDRVLALEDVKKYFGVGRKRGESRLVQFDVQTPKLALRRFITAKKKLIARGCLAEFIANITDDHGKTKETKCLRLLKSYVMEQMTGSGVAVVEEESDDSDEQEEGLLFTHEYTARAMSIFAKGNITLAPHWHPLLWASYSAFIWLCCSFSPVCTLLTPRKQGLYQFYKLIEDSGTIGVSQSEIFHMNIGMGRKQLLRRLDALADHFGVIRIADVTDAGTSKRRTMTYRLFTEENHRKKLAEEKCVGVGEALLAEASQSVSMAAPPAGELENLGYAMQSVASATAPQVTVSLGPEASADVVKRRRPVTTLEKKRSDVILAHLDKVKVTLSMNIKAVLNEAVDHKTVRRLISTLAGSAQLNVYEVTLPLLSGQHRAFTLVCHQSLKLEDPVVQEFITLLRQEDGADPHRYLRTAPERKLDVEDIEVERMHWEGDADLLAEHSAETGRWIAIARNQGFVRALMVRVKLLHQFLMNEFVLVNEGSNETSVAPAELEPVTNQRMLPFLVFLLVTCTLASILERMPLQLFLQVLGHTRAIDNLEVLVAKSSKVGELPVSLRSTLFAKRLPEHRLRRLLDPLHRLHLIAPARALHPAAAVQAVDEGTPTPKSTKGNELQVPGGELVVYSHISASWRSYAFTSRERVVQYWEDLEAFCVRTPRREIVPDDHGAAPNDERAALPEATEVRNWIFQSISVQQRLVLEAHMPAEPFYSKEHPRVEELAQLTKLPAITVWRYLEKEFARKKRRAAAREELIEEEEAEMSSDSSSDAEQHKSKRKKKTAKNQQAKKKKQKRRDLLREREVLEREEREDREAAEAAILPLAQLTGAIAEPEAFASDLPAVPVSDAAQHVTAFINRKRRQREARRAEEAGRAAASNAAASNNDKDDEDEAGALNNAGATLSAPPLRTVWSQGQDMRLLRLYVEFTDTHTRETDWSAIGAAFEREPKACKARFKALQRFPQFKSAIDVGLAPAAAAVAAELPATVEEFRSTYRVLAPHNTPPTPRQQLVRDCAVVVLQTPDEEYKPDLANAILRQFSETEVVEAFDSLRLQGLLARARRPGTSTRAYLLSLSFYRAIDPRLPPNLVADTTEWLQRVTPPAVVAPPLPAAASIPTTSNLPLLLDRFVSGGCVASLLEQCFASGTVALTATHLSATHGAHAGAAALLEKESEKDDAHKPAEWQMHVTSRLDVATRPPCEVSRLLSSSIVPASPPAPAELRFDVAPDLEAELRGETSNLSLIVLYRAAEQGQTHGVTLQVLAAACAPAQLDPLLQKLESRWLIVRVPAYDQQRFVARQHARAWCLVCPPAPVTVLRPWLRADGHSQQSFLDALRLKIIVNIARTPGLSLDSLCEQLQPAIAPQHVIDLVDALCASGLVQLRSIDASNASPFAPIAMSRVKCCYPSPAAFSLHAQLTAYNAG